MTSLSTDNLSPSADSLNISINKKFLKLGFAVLAVAVVAGVIIAKSPSADKADAEAEVNTTTQTVSASNNATANTASKVDNKTTTSVNTPSTAQKNYDFMPVETALIKKYGIFDKVKEAGNYKVKEGASTSEIVKQVSIAQFEHKNYFGSIVAYNEGFVKSPKPDNKGIITGFGYNPSVQSKEFNRQIFTSIGKDKSSVDAAVSTTGLMRIEQIDAGTLSKLSVAPQQASQMTEIMKYVFSEPVGKIIGDHAKLTNQQAREFMAKNKMSTTEFGDKLMADLNPNERDTVLYHNYIVGSGGFSKYKGLLSELVVYNFNKTPEQADKVASHFTYKYTTHDGKVLNNFRATENLQTLFVNPDAWAVKIGSAKTYPDSANVSKRLSSLKAQNAADAKGDLDLDSYKQEVEKNGGRVQYEMSYKSAMLDKMSYRTQVIRSRAVGLGGGG